MINGVRPKPTKEFKNGSKGCEDGRELKNRRQEMLKSIKFYRGSCPYNNKI